MTQRRDHSAALLADAPLQVIGNGGHEHASLATEALVVPGQMAYVHIPASSLRSFVDNFFPVLAKNPIADSASGIGHRYRAGHDLFLDVPATFFKHDSLTAVKQIGHIILTDFPTKAGIPIPGFSQHGLGGFLEHAGIHRAWMQLNISDAGFGFLAVADGHSTLMSALDGHLSMDLGTAIETFGAGAIELKLAMIATGANPALMTIAGIQNVLAGVVATWKTISIYVDPLDFFGSATLSAMIGFTVARAVANKEISDSVHDAIRSGIVGALFSVSSAFGYGALSGFAVARLASALAELHNQEANARLFVSADDYRILVQTLLDGNADVGPMLTSTSLNYLSSEAETLPHDAAALPSKGTALPEKHRTFLSVESGLPDTHIKLPTDSISLPDDPAPLLAAYRSTLSQFVSPRAL